MVESYNETLWRIYNASNDVQLSNFTTVANSSSEIEIAIPLVTKAIAYYKTMDSPPETLPALEEFGDGAVHVLDFRYYCVLFVHYLFQAFQFMHPFFYSVEKFDLLLQSH